MREVYINGWGLASSLGPNLDVALKNLHTPPAAQQRVILGLDQSFPYFAITQSGSNWHERCARILRSVVAEASAMTCNGAIYLASSSLNVGALEKNETHCQNIPDFLGQLAKILDWQGPRYWINTACTSSLNAMLMAREAISNEVIDEALIIGFELENQLSIAGFAGMQLLSKTESKPFATERDGLVLGEAIAVLRLSAQTSRWQLAGGTQVIDSSQASGASTKAYQTMLKQTLADAKVSIEDIDLMKVQAAGSIPNDAIEANAINNFFEQSTISPPALLSLKSLLGHTLGASGAVEIALLLEIIERQKWPAQQKNTDVNLRVELASKMPQKTRTILACILGFGGSHTCLAIKDMAIK